MINLYDVLEASNGQLFGEPAAQLFSSFSLIAAQAQENHLFVAIRGDYGDTHQDMEQAVENGASGLLCTEPPTFDTEDVSVIVVKDTQQALFEWVNFVLARFKVRTVAVIGTAKRTTTVAAIATVLESAHMVHTCTDDEQIGRLSLPLALAKLEPGHDVFVTELLATNPGELSELMQITAPHTLIVTEIGRANLSQFESVEQIAAEYQRAVTDMPADGLVVLNYDDPQARALYSETDAHVLTVGAGSFGADLLAFNLVPGPARTGFDLRHGEDRYVGNWVPLSGQAQLYSALFALAVASANDLPMDTALRALTELEPLPGRMNVFIGKNGCLVVDDTYDATPESALDALTWLAKIRDDDTRLIVILGDIDNLGESTRLAHRQVGLRAAEIADVIITEGAQAALAGRAAQDVSTPGQQIHIAYSMKDTIDILGNGDTLTDRDLVYVTGGASARMEAVVKALLDNDDDHAKLVRQSENTPRLALSRRPLRPSWVEFDDQALAGNVRTIKSFIGDDVAMMATVKADAYGHGAVAVSRIALQNGADYLAVASMYEALELRNAGIDAPILVLSYTPIYAVREAVRHNITVTVYDLSLARAYNNAARELRGELRVHVKVDTGMGRLGVLPADAVEMFRHLVTLQHINIEGIYTHFSVADEDRDYTERQVQAFKDVLIPLRAAGIQFDYIHTSNSAGLVLSDTFHFDMVRAGLVMYGYQETQIIEPPINVRPALTWKTVIAQVKTLPTGHAIGYGNDYITRKPERVAVIPVGYADGFRRGPRNWGAVLVGGQLAPVRGRVSMEKTVISVDHIDGVSIGDEVVLLGRQGDLEITAEDIAKQIGTISYEVLTSVIPRVPRQ